jgi:hypothetical protein
MFDSATFIYVNWIQLIYIRLLRKPRDVMFRFDFTSNYSLDILNWQKQDVAHWFGCAEGTKFRRRVFSKYLGQWRVQIHRIIICPKSYNYVHSKLYKT